VTPRRRARISRYLALVLRHDPGRVGLTLDRHGWADVDQLIAASAGSGVEFTAEELREVVETNAKQRFAFDPDARRIRANQGHSVAVDLGLSPVAPPPVLYHGTSTRALDGVRRAGLLPMGRTHVHLSRDEATAETVGRRHGPAVVLAVDSARMHADGHRFYVSANGVWLTEAVPPAYLSATSRRSGTPIE
jgi:putative RNA 2'-phosphotransferase